LIIEFDDSKAPEIIKALGDGAIHCKDPINRRLMMALMDQVERRVRETRIVHDALIECNDLPSLYRFADMLLPGFNRFQILQKIVQLEEQAKT
jgi:hypothetical protein